MATKSSLPRNTPPTGEQWIQADDPKELLNWVKAQSEPMAYSHKLLLCALRHGKWNCATELLRYSESLVQVCDEMQQNVLFYWADGVQRSQNVEEATEWLKERVPLELIKKMIGEANEEGSSLFHAVAAIGQYQLMQWILNMFPEVDVNQMNRYGYTALHKAARYGQLEAILWLLEHQADISVITVNGDRPEHEALKYEHIEIISFLQSPIHWPDHLDSDIQISMQAKYDRAQAIRLSVPKTQLFAKKAKEYHLNQLSICGPEYETLTMQSIQSVPQLAIACLLSLSDVMLSHVLWMDGTQEKINIYRQAMGYAAVASTIAAQNFNLPNALLWQKQASSQQIRVLTQILPSSKVIPLQLFDVWKKKLVRLRRHCTAKEDTPPLNMTKQITKGLCSILKKIWKFVVDRLPPPPCEYALLALGSLGREEATPYSDIECACLIAEDSTEIREYFMNSSSIFEVTLIGLGETPEELLGLFNNCDEQPQIICSGLHTDHFYMPHRNPDLLIQTPIGLANVQRDDNWKLMDRQILLNCQKVVGSDELYLHYQNFLRQMLRTNLGSWLNPHRLQEEISLGIVKQIVKTLSPMSQAVSVLEKGHVGISVKEQLYRLPQQIMLALSLYYNLTIGHVLDQLNSLQKVGAFCNETSCLLNSLLHQALGWRIKAQMYYQSAHEWLYQPNTQVPHSVTRPYRLSPKEQNELIQLFAILWPLYQRAIQWRNEETPLFLKRAVIHQVDALGRMLVHVKFNEMDEAIRCYRVRFCVSPHNIESLTVEVQAQNQQYILALSKLNQWHVWHQSLIRNWAVNCVQADLHLELLGVFRDLLVVPEERTIFVAELEAHKKVCPNNDADFHQLYNNWLSKCQQEIQNYHPQWIKRIQQWKDEKQQNSGADESIVEWYQIEQNRKEYLSASPRSRCQLFTLLRPAFDQVYKLLIDVLKKCEKKLGIDVKHDKSSLSRLIDVLVTKCRDLKTYQRIYQSLDHIDVRVAFRQILIFRQEKSDELTQKFIGGVLTALHRLPDKRGETTFWKEEKKRWKTTLQMLIEERAPRENEPTINSPLIGGCKPLKGKIAVQLLDENGEFRKNRISDGQRDVIPIKVEPNALPIIYAKAWPEMPGMSYLMEQFHYRIIGHGTYHSELVCLTYANGTSMPVLCSEAIHGPTLQEVFKKEPERLHKLDHQHYTELLFVSLLTNPEDGLPANYITKHLDNGTDTLVSIDHDHALFPDWLPDKDGGNLQLQIKTILFCFDQICQQINSTARERFLALDARQTMESIFRDAQSQNELYGKLFSSETLHRWHHASNKSCTIPIPLKKGDAVAIYSRWLRLRTLLQHHSDVTGLQCLIQIHPKAGITYNDALEKYKSPIQRLAQLGRYKLNQHGVMVSNTRALYTLSRARVSLQVSDTLGTTYWELKDLTPAEALAELDQLSCQQQKLEKICEELSFGNFKPFEELLSVEHKSLILKGDAERGLLPFDWSVLTHEQHLKLSQIVQLHSFEELSLRGFNFKIWNFYHSDKIRANLPMTVENFFAEMHNLSWLNISNSNIDDKTLGIVANQCRALQTLIARRCSQLQGTLLLMFPSLTELVLDESGLMTLNKLQAMKLERFQANNCRQLTRVEIGCVMSVLKKWRMIDAIALVSLKLKAPALETLHLGGCSIIENISTGSNSLSVLDIQGCKLLDSVGLTELTLPSGRSKLEQAIIANTIFSSVIQYVPQALFFRYHPPQNDLFKQIELVYYNQFKNSFTLSNRIDVQHFKDNLLQFLEKFDKRIKDIFNNEEAANIVKYLRAINGIGKEEKQSVLIQLEIALKDKNAAIRMKVLQSIGLVGPEAATESILNQLALILKKHDFNALEAVINTVGLLGPVAATNDILTQLALILNGKDDHIRVMVADTLGLLGPKAATKDVVYQLTAILRDENRSIRKHATKALGLIGPAAATEDTVDQLTRALDDEDVEFCNSALEALTRLGPVAIAPILNQLGTLLCDANKYNRQNAVKALGLLGPAAATESVLDQLLVALKDEDWNVRQNVVEVLGLMAPASITKSVLEGLEITLQDKEKLIRLKALRTLRTFGPTAATENVLKKLINVVLNDEYHYIRKEAAEILCSIGPSNIINEPINTLLVALSDNDCCIRINAAKTLGNFGSAATEDVLNALTVALRDENKESVLNQLTICLNDADQYVSCCAQRVLTSLRSANTDSSSTIHEEDNKTPENTNMKMDNIWKCSEIIALENFIQKYHENLEIQPLQREDTLNTQDQSQPEEKVMEEPTKRRMSSETAVVENSADQSPSNLLLVNRKHSNENLQDKSVDNNEEKKENNNGRISRKKKKEEIMKIIEENNQLKIYYETVVATLNNEFLVARVLHSGKVDHSVPWYISATKEGLSAIPIPGLNIVGTMAETLYKIRQTSNSKTLAMFFADPMEQHLIIKTLACHLAIARKQDLITLSNRFLSPTKISIKDAVLGCDDNTIICRRAQQDCAKLISAIENNKIKVESRNNIEQLMKFILNEIPQDTA
ncbi:peptidase C14 [Reticulomyxa filosa]|uniref:Peptidase C14 n=1 Tax=Reticulomyxa filosa TaxID=46433 RepID=X6NVA0_RETFI|nr:peptidase C14 [Reticulomyxa filosa]|eukprot:ETO29818.1 peptidase C14 [Reticulomyxa filosa]